MDDLTRHMIESQSRLYDAFMSAIFEIAAKEREHKRRAIGRKTRLKFRRDRWACSKT